MRSLYASLQLDAAGNPVISYFDGAGNVHTIGNFEGTVDFDPGPGTDNRTSNGDSDAFVTKLGPTGTHQWAAVFGGISLDLGFGIAVAGNVHSTGWFNSTADFDPGPGTTNRTSNGFDDAFIVELAAKGVCNGLLVTVDLAAGDTPTSGDDVIAGTPGPDTIYGADGNDSLTGDFGNDIILGGNDNDTINSQDGEADQVSGNAGTFTCTRDVGIDNVFACETLLP